MNLISTENWFILISTSTSKHERKKGMLENKQVGHQFKTDKDFSIEKTQSSKWSRGNKKTEKKVFLKLTKHKFKKRILSKLTLV